MSSSKKYYYVVSGLPEISFDTKLPFTLNDMLDEYQEDLKGEAEHVNLIILNNDLRNLKDMFKEDGGDEKDRHLPSIYSIDELKEIVKVRDGVPEFVVDFLERYESRQDYLNNFHELEKGYFIYGTTSSNEFLSKYFQFELDFRNVISAVRSRGKETDIIKYTAGTGDEIVLSKVRNNKSLPDFGLSGEAKWVEKVISAFDKDDPLNLEETIDKIRFEQIDDMILSMGFESDVLFAYMIKLQILERWASFDQDKGKKYIRNIVKSILK